MQNRRNNFVTERQETILKFFNAILIMNEIIDSINMLVSE